MEPDLAFVNTSSNSACEVATPPIKCYDCGGFGHRASTCRNRRIRCFKCGRYDVTIRDCPNCNGARSPSGGRAREFVHSGNDSGRS